MAFHVLLAEDDRLIRESLAEGLSSQGFVVSAFDNAEDALDCARNLHVDVALFDVVLPGMTGVDALTLLKRQQPTANIMIMTAFATVDLAVEAMKKGADEFIVKPVSIDMIVMTMKRLHAKRTPSSPRDERQYDLIFSALSNPIRRMVVKQLKIHRKLKFMDLCRVVGIEDHTKFNFHLKQLVQSKLVIKEENRVYSLTEQGTEVYNRMLQ